MAIAQPLLLVRQLLDLPVKPLDRLTHGNAELLQFREGARPESQPLQLDACLLPGTFQLFPLAIALRFDVSQSAGAVQGAAQWVDVAGIGDGVQISLDLFPFASQFGSATICRFASGQQFTSLCGEFLNAASFGAGQAERIGGGQLGFAAQVAQDLARREFAFLTAENQGAAVLDRFPMAPQFFLQSLDGTGVLQQRGGHLKLFDGGAQSLPRQVSLALVGTLRFQRAGDLLSLRREIVRQRRNVGERRQFIQQLAAAADQGK